MPPATFTAGGIQSVITAGSASGGSFAWTIAQGTAELSFASGKQQSTTTTSSNSVTVYTIGRSQSKNDVIVRLIWTPQNSVSAVPASLPLSIDSPYLLTQLSSTGPTAVADCTVHAAGNVGWWSQYKWWEFSFFGVQVFGASINENFANQTEYQANNWDFTPNGSPGVSGQSTFIDNFCFANQTAANPKTAQPDNPLGNNEVDSATQTYSVGSTTVGAAIPVQTQTLSRYLDHATVTNITTPVANQ